jgi:hypothetical protein
MVSNSQADVSLNCTYSFRSLLASARTARSRVETTVASGAARSAKCRIVAASPEPGVGHAGRPDCTDYLVGGLATTAEGSIQRRQADRRARDVSSLRSTKSSGDQPSSARTALILRIDTSRSEVETRNANDARLPMHFAIAAPLLAAPPGSSWAMMKRRCCGCGGKNAVLS